MIKRMFAVLFGGCLIFGLTGCGEKIDTTGTHAYANTLKAALEKASDSIVLDYAVAMQLSSSPSVKLTIEEMNGKTLEEIARLVKRRNSTQFTEDRTAMEVISKKFPGLAKDLRRNIIEQSSVLLYQPNTIVQSQSNANSESAEGELDESEDMSSGD